jgi:FPC/CPF motif-containing protein YcgG
MRASSGDAQPVSYGVFATQGSQLRRVTDGHPASASTQLLHDEFLATILSSVYPCVLGASVLRNRNYAFALYREFGGDRSASQLAADIEWFVRTHPVPRVPGEPFASFIAIFDGPSLASEADFERLMWRHLDLLHEHDRQRFGWDPAVSADMENPYFSFSVAGCAFFVVGMHPKASRIARMTRLPALVFNRHEQFEELRRRGLMARTTRIIQIRDQRLHGRVYSALAAYGEISEARQYAGRDVDANWRCPFAPRLAKTAEERLEADGKAR